MRRTRERSPRGESRVGERFTVDVGPVAHGGHCVARVREEGDRVVFVRHALPGERVVVELTEGTEGDRFWRGDAVEVLEPSGDRVAAPCPYAGPRLCGGCDFQHVALPAQRALKEAVVREQLVRLGGLATDHPLVAGLVVEPVAGDAEGLRWRTRMEYAVAPDGSPGLRRHRSRSVVPVDDCLIAALDAIETSLPGGPVSETVAAAGSTYSFDVERDGFWQVHPGAPATLVSAVLELLDPRPCERALDLYAGVGLFAAFLAERVGERGRVVAVEANRAAAGHARANLSVHPQVEVRVGPVARVLAAHDEPCDLVVLDPPREGAKRAVVEQVVARQPRGVAYVACDPAALARDLRTFAEHGYPLTGLRAFDLFPMTSHVECVALLEKTGSDLRRSDSR
jgi:tRNA/tmRNA/rRNA uracil-C5-methylase (TrmA/RlmC/RlmD family)